MATEGLNHGIPHQAIALQYAEERGPTVEHDQFARRA